MGGGASTEFSDATKADEVASAFKNNCVGKYFIVTGDPILI